MPSKLTVVLVLNVLIISNHKPKSHTSSEEMYRVNNSS